MAPLGAARRPCLPRADHADPGGGDAGDPRGDRAQRSRASSSTSRRPTSSTPTSSSWATSRSSALLVVIITGAAAVAGERRGGTAVLVLTKPLSRTSFVWAKVIANLVVLVLATAIGAALRASWAPWCCSILRTSPRSSNRSGCGLRSPRCSCASWCGCRRLWTRWRRRPEPESPCTRSCSHSPASRWCGIGALPASSPPATALLRGKDVALAQPHRGHPRPRRGLPAPGGLVVPAQGALGLPAPEPPQCHPVEGCRPRYPSPFPACREYTSVATH